MAKQILGLTLSLRDYVKAYVFILIRLDGDGLIKIRGKIGWPNLDKVEFFILV
jgi:hypothetical protein